MTEGELKLLEWLDKKAERMTAAEIRTSGVDVPRELAGTPLGKELRKMEHKLSLVYEAQRQICLQSVGASGHVSKMLCCMVKAMLESRGKDIHTKEAECAITTMALWLCLPLPTLEQVVALLRQAKPAGGQGSSRPVVPHPGSDKIN